MTKQTPSSLHDKVFNYMLQELSSWKFQKVPEILLAAPAVHRLVDKHFLYVQAYGLISWVEDLSFPVTSPSSSCCKIDQAGYNQDTYK